MRTERNWSGLLGGNEAADANLLVFWHRTAPAWREILPLTPVCQEIIEPCSVPDCMLSWCRPNLFHSLIRGFVCRKGTEWVPGGMTSTSTSCCHADVTWNLNGQIFLSPSVGRCSYNKAWQGFGLLSNFDELLWALGFVILRVGSNTGFDLTALSPLHMWLQLCRNSVHC